MTLRDWADVSVVWLAFLFFVFSLIPAVIFYFSIRGVNRMMSGIRTYSPRVRAGFRQASEVAEKTSQKVTSPFVTMRAASAQVRGSLSALFPSAAATSAARHPEPVSSEPGQGGRQKEG